MNPLDLADNKYPSDRAIQAPYSAILNLPIPSLSSLYPPTPSLLDGATAGVPRDATQGTSHRIPRSTHDPSLHSGYLDLLSSLIGRHRMHPTSDHQHPANLWTNLRLDEGAAALSSLLTTGPLIPHAYPTHQLLLTPGNTVPNVGLKSHTDGFLGHSSKGTHVHSYPQSVPKYHEDPIDVCDLKDSKVSKHEYAHNSSTEQLTTADPNPDDDPDDEQETNCSLPLPNFSRLGSECARTVPSLMKCYSRHKRSLSSSLSVSLAVSGQAEPPSSPISPGSFQRPATASAVVSDRPYLPMPVHDVPSETPGPYCPTSYSSHPIGFRREETTPKTPTCTDKKTNKPGTSNVSVGLAPPSSKITHPTITTTMSRNDKAVTSVTCSSIGQLLSPTPAVTTRPNPFSTGWPHTHTPISQTAPPARLWIPQGVDHGVGAGLGLGYHFARDPLTGHLLLLPRAHPLPGTGNSHGIMWTGYGSIPPPPMVMTPQQLLLGDPHFRHPIHPSVLQLPTMSSPKPDAREDDAPRSAKVPLTTPSPRDIPPPPHYLYPPSSMPYFFPQHQTFLPTYSHLTSSGGIEPYTTGPQTIPTNTEPVVETVSHAPSCIASPRPPETFPVVPDDNCVPIDLTNKTKSHQSTNSTNQKRVVIKREIKEELLSPSRPNVHQPLVPHPIHAIPPTQPPSMKTEPESVAMDIPDPGRSTAEPHADMTGLELLSHSILQHVSAQSPSHSESSSHSDTTMPKLERITFSPSPRRSPSSCEFPPVLTPLNTHTPMASPTRDTHDEPVSGLSILCALAEQELAQTSALSSLAEVAASHQPIHSRSPKRTWDEAISDHELSHSPRRDHPCWQDFRPHHVPETDSNSTGTLKDVNDYIEDINQNYTSPGLEKDLTVTPTVLTEHLSTETPEDIESETVEPKREVSPGDTELAQVDTTFDDVSSPVNSLEEQMSFNGFSEPSDTFSESDTESVKGTSIKLEHSPPIDGLSDTELLVPSLQKRKPGRPKKHSPVKRSDFTETIMARQNKSQDFMMVSHKSKLRPPQLKAELNELDSSIEEDFSEESTQEEATDTEMETHNSPHQSIANMKPLKVGPRSSLTRRAMLRDKEQRTSSLASQSQLKELFRSLKKHSKVAAAEHDESEDEKDDLSDTEQTDVKVKTESPESLPDQSEDETISDPANGSELLDKTTERPQETDSSHADKVETSVCTLFVEDLIEATRVLVLEDGLLYAGNLRPITPPDLYEVYIDGERTTRPRIYCRDELLMQAWKEVKPGSTRFLTEGTRVCAFWSPQYRGLYPGGIAAASSPSHEGNHNFVNVEFDDGDSGRIHVDDVRLLPTDFPVIDYDPNPLLTLNRRKRRITEDAPDSTRTSKPSKDINLKLIINKKSPSSKLSPCYDFPAQPPKKKHKKSKHKHRNKVSSFMTIEQGDSELRLRIRSPTHLAMDRSISHDHVDQLPAEPLQSTPKNEKTPPPPERKKKRSPSEKSKIAPFLPDRQLWKWSGKSFKRPGAKGKGKKEFYKEIVRGKEHIRVGDCAVFLSTGRPDRPYIGQIEFLWESWGGNMVVKVKWFYHPDETKGLGKRLAETKGALFQSSHTDENDVQTVSRRCSVIPLAEYKMKRAALEKERGVAYDNHDLYYLAGFYDPFLSKITMEPGVS